MAEKIPTNFNKEAFKEALAHVESAGGKFLENSSSSAVGKYQFLWSNIQHDSSLKGISKRQFINDPELQEMIMDKALNGSLKGYPNYIENARKLKSDFNSSLRVDEIALLTHFLGAGGVKEQLKSGAYEVPGVNMSVDGYTGKYNKYLEKMGLNGGQSLTPDVPSSTDNTQQEIPQTDTQQDTQEDPYNLVERGSKIGMDNPPYATEPQRDPFAEAQDLGGVEQEMESIRPELRVTVQDDVEAFRGYMDQNQQAFEAQELIKAQQNAPVDPRKVQRIKNMLSPGKEGSGYGEDFENTQDPTMNIVDNNSFAYGGYTKQNRYVDGGDPIDPPEEELVSSTTGDSVTTTNFSPTTNEYGLKGITRTRNTTTPSTNLFKTPKTTAEGNAAYEALTLEQQQAQDAKWRQMNSSDTTTETDSTYFLDPMQPEGINFRGMAGGTDLPQIGDAAQYQGEPKRDPMYYIYGNSIPNSQFGGHSSSMITSDPNIKNDISHILSPGDISKNSPRSGERNIAIHRQLTEAEQDAAETRYGQSWHRPIPADIGEEMIRKEGENQAEVQRRNLQKHEESLVNQERVEGNIASDLAKRSEIEANKQAQIQARVAAKEQADAQKAAQRQEVIDSRSQNPMAKGGMIKRADGSYSKRGLWDNIRDNRGSGKKPTKQMLEQERKINAKAYGGSVETGDSENFTEFKGGGTHEQNSLGGIPQGMGSNGKLNTVEEGETKVTIDGEDYIFSQRGMLDGSGFDSRPSTNQFFGGGAASPADAMGKTKIDGMGAASAGVAVANQLVDLVPDKGDAPNATGIEGIQNTGDVGLGAVKGALSGASAGAPAGPWGMAAGAVVGLGAALIGGNKKNKKIQAQNQVLYAQANPAMHNQNYGGGYLKKKKSNKKSRIKEMLRNK